MAHATPFILYARFPNHLALERFLFFIEKETRPDFPDEVHASEAKLVELFEFLAYPWKLERLDTAVLAYFGDPHEEQDLHEDITPMMKGAKALGAKQVLVYWSYEQERVFEQWHLGRKRLLWAVDDPEASEKTGLNDTLRKRLRAELVQDAGKALVTLAKALST